MDDGEEARCGRFWRSPNMVGVLSDNGQLVGTMTLCPRGYNPPLVRRCGRWRRRYPRRLTVTLACLSCSVPEIPWQEWQGSAFARVRLRSLACAESPANRSFERTGANGRERSLALAMQKVEGSSPFIRFKSLQISHFCRPDGKRIRTRGKVRIVQRPGAAAVTDLRVLAVPEDSSRSLHRKAERELS